MHSIDDLCRWGMWTGSLNQSGVCQSSLQTKGIEGRNSCQEHGRNIQNLLTFPSMLTLRNQWYRCLTDYFHLSRRSLTQTRQLEDLLQLYELLKHESLCKSVRTCFSSISIIASSLWIDSTHSYSKIMDPNGIFPNNELDLQKIKVYGFDFGERFQWIFKAIFDFDRLYSSKI